MEMKTKANTTAACRPNMLEKQDKYKNKNKKKQNGNKVVWSLAGEGYKSQGWKILYKKKIRF